VKIAGRTGQYDGTTEPEFLDEDGEWHRGVMPEGLGLPVAARCGVRRKGFSQPQVGVARWARYCAYRETPDGRLEVSEAWVKGGPEQLAKCALADAFRKAFWEEIGALYTLEEMAQAKNPPHARPSSAGQVERPLAAAARHSSAAAAAAAAPAEEEVEIDETTPETAGDFAKAIEEFGFGTERARRDVVARLRMGIPFAPTSRTFYAVALKRLRTRPDLYGARPAAVAV
jgi:hypothetical protein